MKENKDLTKRLLAVLTEIHEQDFGDDNMSWKLHQEEDDCWICQLIDEAKNT